MDGIGDTLIEGLVEGLKTRKGISAGGVGITIKTLKEKI